MVQGITEHFTSRRWPKYMEAPQNHGYQESIELLRRILFRFAPPRLPTQQQHSVVIPTPCHGAQSEPLGVGAAGNTTTWLPAGL
jgi:hypothetical protein